MRFKTLLNQTEFLKGAVKPSQFPPDSGYEIALAGRSNAGKSSALNALTSRRALARVSKTPGRTREINFFTVSETIRLVDLPGYGYAKVSNEIRARWLTSLNFYLQGRQSLRGMLLFMDSRHPLKDLDLELLDWTAAAAIPVHCVLTKSDKLKRGEATTLVARAAQTLATAGIDAGVQMFSARNGYGMDELLAVMAAWVAFDPSKK